MSKIVSFFSRRSRSEGNFETLLAPHIERLYKQAYKYLGNEHDAEELVQELLVDLYQKQDAMRAAPVLEAWLSRCLYNRFVDNYRKARSRPALEAGSEEALEQHVCEKQTSAEDHVWLAQVFKGLECLSCEQRMVIALHDIEGHTLVDIAEMMSMPVGTLKSHLHRGRKALKKGLELQPFSEALRLDK